MRAVIIDDEPKVRTYLKSLLTKYCRQVEVIGEAGNAYTGGDLILEAKPDLVFLDIQMPKGSGFDLLTSLGAYEFDVIFVTGYDQYAIQAVRCSALDYLLKPIEIPELIAAVKKAESRIEDSRIESQIENLLDIIKHPNKQDHKIALPVAKGHRFINPFEIIYLRSSNNYTSFKMIDKENILISKGLYYFEDTLTAFGLIRCHASYIVNPKYIIKFSRGITGHELLLLNGESLPVTSMYIQTVNERLGLLK